MSPPDTPALSPIRTLNRPSLRTPAPVESHSHSHNHSSSPFLHNLTQRLRKGSNASSHSGEHPSPLSATVPLSPPPMAADPVKKTESSRAARRMLFSLIRDDWEYPSTNVTEGEDETTPGPVPAREPIGFRLREVAQSDIEIEEGILSKRGLRPNNNRTNSSSTDPYKFENPDAVGDFVAQRLRRRRRLLEEEMKWNEGLRIWTQRRDTWTGAVKHKPIMLDAGTIPSSNTGSTSATAVAATNKHHAHKSSFWHPHLHIPGHEHHRHSSDPEPHDDDATHGDKDNPTGPHQAHQPSPNSDHSDPNSHANSNSNATPSPQSPSMDNSNSNGNSNNTSNNPPSDPNNTDEIHPGEPGSGPWIPIYPPLLPQEDVLRDRIKPQAYPTIYSKVVVQSMTPNVPIPLKHMIPALVEGWKAEGSWPPQPAAVAAQDVKKGRRSSAFAKWRREHHFDSKAAEHHAGVVNEDGKSRVRRSIGMMRKVLGGVGTGNDDDDGGLGELGFEFREQDEEEALKNVTLNTGNLKQGDGPGQRDGNGNANAAGAEGRGA
ncbi:hypothetical protein ABEF93_006081 [Exophiala dermatitidis]